MNVKNAALLSTAFCLCCPVIAGGAGAPPASPNTAQQLAAKGLREGARSPGLSSLCDLRSGIFTAPANGGGGLPPALANKSPTEPAQVFDNLFYVGTAFVSSWVIRTSAGLILIDTLDNTQEAKTYIEGGLRKLGLDPRQIKYVIITHAHDDHSGGAQYLVSTYNPRVIMTATDWAALEKITPRPDTPNEVTPPTRDISFQGRRTLTLGDTTVNLYETPGHTPGTLSMIFGVKDQGVPHTVGLWGGTGLNFGPDAAQLRVFSASAARFLQPARQLGVDVFLTTHPFVDGTPEAVTALKARQPGAANPFVAGSAALGAFELMRDCTLAQAMVVESSTGK